MLTEDRGAGACFLTYKQLWTMCSSIMNSSIDQSKHLAEFVPLTSELWFAD